MSLQPPIACARCLIRLKPIFVTHHNAPLIYGDYCILQRFVQYLFETRLVRWWVDLTRVFEE